MSYITFLGNRFCVNRLRKLIPNFNVITLQPNVWERVQDRDRNGSLYIMSNLHTATYVRVLYFGIVSVPVPVPVPFLHKFCLNKPSRLVHTWMTGTAKESLQGLGLINQLGAFTLKGASMTTATVSSWNGLGTHFAVATAMEKNGFNGIKWGVGCYHCRCCWCPPVWTLATMSLPLPSLSVNEPSSLVHTVSATAILGLKKCEHFHLVLQYPCVTSTFDETKIMKIMPLPSQYERALKHPCIRNFCL